MVTVKLTWVAISVPWSQVTDRASWLGKGGDGFAHGDFDVLGVVTIREMQEQDEAG